MVVHVHDEVLAHDSQTNECNICSVETNNHIYRQDFMRNHQQVKKTQGMLRR